MSLISLHMCMGFGCNAAAITSCRIIETKRERLIAILTNNFVPCNGRFPTLIMLSVMFFGGGTGGIRAAVFVAIIIVSSVLITLFMSKLLSVTVLKGKRSAFTLELPPYRRPQLGKIITRSIADRTIFVLGRAISVAVPAGALIWILQNITFGGSTAIEIMAGVADPFARMMGMDGIILMAFILGLPANEIVIPIILMCYSGGASLSNIGGSFEMGNIFLMNGWTWLTALCTIIFSLNHFPCATTLLTIKKETGSIKWTIAAFLMPTVVGVVLCIAITSFVRLFGLV